MITEQDIETLASLARIDLSTDEKNALRLDLESILNYISQLREASAELPVEQDLGLVKNVWREDGTPHLTGLHTEKLLAQMVKQKDNFMVVKKILANDNNA